MLCYPIQVNLTTRSSGKLEKPVTSIAYPTTRENDLQRTHCTLAGLTQGFPERPFSCISHERSKKSHFSRLEKAKDHVSPAQPPQTIGSLWLVGPACPKGLSIIITLFVQSVWDYPPRNPSGTGKQRHGLQLIAQLHSLPTLSKINSHHTSNLFPCSPLQRQLPEEPPAGKRRLPCPKPGRSHLPPAQSQLRSAGTALPGARAHPP